MEPVDFDLGVASERPRRASPRRSEIDHPQGPGKGNPKGADRGGVSRNLGGPFGAIMAELRPSRPHHPPKEGFPAPRFFRESSGARRGPDFRLFS